MTPALVRVLHSLKEDANHAYKRALDGDDSGLEALGRSMKLVEQEVIAADCERRLRTRRALR